MTERHTRQNNFAGQIGRRWSSSRRRPLDYDRVIAAEGRPFTRPCCCTGLVHEHDPPACPAEPVEEDG